MVKLDTNQYTLYKKSFLENGFFILPEFLSKEEIGKSRFEVDRFCKDFKKSSLNKNSFIPLSSLKEDQNPSIIIHPSNDSPYIISNLLGNRFFRKLIQKKALWNLASCFLETKKVAYHFSNITRKPAKIGPRVNWHRDSQNKYICPENSENFLRFLLPFDHMTSQNGGTQFIPNSHQDQSLSVKYSQKKTLECKAGSLIAIKPKLLHGGEPNRSKLNRDLLVIQFGIQSQKMLYLNNELGTGSSREEIIEKNVNISPF